MFSGVLGWGSPGCRLTAVLFNTKAGVGGSVRGSLAPGQEQRDGEPCVLELLCPCAGHRGFPSPPPPCVTPALDYDKAIQSIGIYVPNFPAALGNRCALGKSSLF